MEAILCDHCGKIFSDMEFTRGNGNGEYYELCNKCLAEHDEFITAGRKTRSAGSDYLNDINSCNYGNDDVHDELYAIFKFPDGIKLGRCKKHFDEAIKYNLSHSTYLTIFPFPVRRGDTD